MLGKDHKDSKSFVKESEKLPQDLFLRSKAESSEVIENQSPDRNRRKSAMIFKRDPGT